MSTCAHCKQKLSKDWAFCAECGESTPRRQQIFEVIVRQAISGAPWRTICQSPMQANKITEDEIVAEAKARGYDLK